LSDISQVDQVAFGETGSGPHDAEDPSDTTFHRSNVIAPMVSRLQRPAQQINRGVFFRPGFGVSDLFAVEPDRRIGQGRRESSACHVALWGNSAEAAAVPHKESTRDEDKKYRHAPGVTNESMIFRPPAIRRIFIESNCFWRRRVARRGHLTAFRDVTKRGKS
jgi:hypothetical protein